MENPEQQLKAYTEAEEISMDKVLAMKGIIFEEAVLNNGTLEFKKHVALPVVVGKLDKLYEFTDKLASVGSDAEFQMGKLKPEIEKVEQMAEGEERFKEQEKINKKIKDINRNYSKKINDIRLDIALMCFERTEKTTKEEIANWITSDILERIDFFALGLTLPPKQ